MTEFLAANWVWILFLLLMVGMHRGGHGCGGHGHSGHQHTGSTSGRDAEHQARHSS